MKKGTREEGVASAGCPLALTVEGAGDQDPEQGMAEGAHGRKRGEGLGPAGTTHPLWELAQKWA